MPYYESLILYFDGASRHNPREFVKNNCHVVKCHILTTSLLLDGPAGCGWALYDNSYYDDVSLFSTFFFNSLCVSRTKKN
jgi:ribonuclease HI